MQHFAAFYTQKDGQNDLAQHVETILTGLLELTEILIALKLKIKSLQFSAIRGVMCTLCH